MNPHICGGPQSGPSRFRTPWLLVAGMCVIVLFAGACTGDELADEDAAVVGAGIVEIADGDEWDRVARGGVVAVGSTIRSRGREARLSFRDATVRLAPHTKATVTEDAIELDTGEALVDGDLRVAYSRGEVSGDGVYRVRVRPSPLVRVYDGSAVARGGDDERSVPPLRELALDGRHLPETPAPLAYLRSDPWDRELLADAIAFDEEAARTLAGLSALVGDGLKPRSFFAQYFDAPLLALVEAAALRVSKRRYGPAGDVLLALALVAAAEDDPAEAEALLAHVMVLRQDGARWGLIASELGVDAATVVAVLDARQDRRVALVRQAEETTASASTTAGDSDGPASADGGAGGSSSGDGSTGDGDTGGQQDTAPRDDDSRPPRGGGGTPDDRDGDDPEAPREPDDPEDPEEPRPSPVDDVVEDVTGTPTPQAEADTVSTTVDAVIEEVGGDRR